jgi:hypothetical protein
MSKPRNIDQFRLKVLKTSGAPRYIPQIKKAGRFSRWRTLSAERMHPEIVRVFLDPSPIWSYTKESAMAIIKVYKTEQEQSKTTDGGYIYL